MLWLSIIAACYYLYIIAQTPCCYWRTRNQLRVVHFSARDDLNMPVCVNYIMCVPQPCIVTPESCKGVWRVMYPVRALTHRLYSWGTQDSALSCLDASPHCSINSPVTVVTYSSFALLRMWHHTSEALWAATRPLGRLNQPHRATLLCLRYHYKRSHMRHAAR